MGSKNVGIGWLDKNIHDMVWLKWLNVLKQNKTKKCQNKGYQCGEKSFDLQNVT